jgi:hypothetical protein
MKKIITISVLLATVIAMALPVALSRNNSKLTANAASAESPAIVNLFDANDKDTLYGSLLSRYGTIAENAEFITSGYIAVEPDRTYVYNSGGVYLAAYNKDKQFIGYVDNDNKSSTIVGFEQVCFFDKGYTKTYIPAGKGIAFVRPLYSITNTVPVFYNASGYTMTDAHILRTLNLYKSDDVNGKSNTIVDRSGVEIDNTTLKVSGYIKVEGGNWYSYNTTGVYSVAYDVNKNFLYPVEANMTMASGFKQSTEDGYSKVFVPSGEARFVRVFYDMRNTTPIFSKGEKLFTNLYDDLFPSQQQAKDCNIEIKITRTAGNSDQMDAIFADIANGVYKNFMLSASNEVFSTNTKIKNTSNEIIFKVNSAFTAICYGIADNTYSNVSLTLFNEDTTVMWNGTAQVRLFSTANNTATAPDADDNKASGLMIALGIGGGLLAIGAVVSAVQKAVPSKKKRRW